MSDISGTPVPSQPSTPSASSETATKPNNISTCRPLVHAPLRNGTKLTWSLDLQPTTKYLVIGDSNLRNITLPDTNNTQIECYPGAHFHHINDLIRSIPPTHNLKHIFINVGVNEKNNDFVNTTSKKLNTLANSISHLNITNTFIAIPCPQQIFSTLQTSNIERMNESAKKNFFHYMKLTDSSIKDNSGHLTDTAITALAHKIVKYISETENSNITHYLNKPTNSAKNSKN
jgi:hypothetical protein